MKAYSSFSWEQKEKIYSLARAGVSDEALCERYDVDEAILLRMYDEVLCELQRRRGYSGPNQHMRCNHGAGSIHHAADTKDPSSNRGNDCDFEN